MLDIKFIRENKELIKEGCRKKQVEVDIDKIIELDEKRRGLIPKIEKLRSEMNKKTKLRPRPEEIKELKTLSAEIKNKESELKKIEEEFEKLILLVPNLPKKDVKEGKDERDNEIIKKWSEPTKFDFKPLDHLELGEKLDLIDVQRAAKVSGTRFGYLKNEAVLLEFALINFALDILTKEGFIPIIPPSMIGERAMRGMGYLDRGAEEVYKIEKDNLYLIGTSEQSVGPMYLDEIIDEKVLPLRYTAFSSCFRREAGSYGKDTKGIFRVHQFDKLEMFSYTKPEDSDKEHEFLLSLEEKFFQTLEIPYQVVKMCTGDLGDPAARKYDLEAWIPSQNKYREVTSTSTCTDFQARRLNIRYRDRKGKLEFVHTLNGTAFAMGRTLIALLENYQQKDGSIKIPPVLQKYCGFKEIKKN